MEMYGKIIVPLDGSKMAEAALPYAAKLAAKTRSGIVLLSVLDSVEIYDSDESGDYLEKTVETTKRRVETYLGESNGRTIKIGAATRTGYPAQGIINYARKGDSDLIVMATHGRSGIGRWALGSVADKVVRTATRQPVMLIRAQSVRPDISENGVLQKILVPLDGSITSEVTIPYVSEIASKLRAELTLIRVIPQSNHTGTDAEGYLKGISEMLESKGITAKYEVRVGAEADEIIDLADELNSDMVAMSTRGRTGVSRWVLGSVAQKVLLGGNTPLLLMKE